MAGQHGPPIIPTGVLSAEELVPRVIVETGFDRPVDAIPGNPVFEFGTGVKIVGVLFGVLHDSPIG